MEVLTGAGEAVCIGRVDGEGGWGGWIGRVDREGG